MNIKMRLLLLRKKQVDLVAELHKRGYKEVFAPTLCNCINGKLNTPKAFEIRRVCDEILTEWEKGTEG